MNIADNITKIKAELAKANKKTQLIAVSKMHNADAVREALAAGQFIFGENRVQEAQEKFPALQAEFKKLELHLIGPLQTNKVNEALELFDVIQTVDREKLALKLSEELHRRAALSSLQSASSQSAAGKQKQFYVQVNTGEEEQKAGIEPLKTVEFVNYCHNDLKLNITGLMCIPPVEEQAYLHFGLLKNIALKLQSPMKLSMGMSGDYLVAAEFGADFVRIGSAIFGSR